MSRYTSLEDCSQSKDLYGEYRDAIDNALNEMEAMFREQKIEKTLPPPFLDSGVDLRFDRWLMKNYKIETANLHYIESREINEMRFQRGVIYDIHSDDDMLLFLLRYK